MTRHDIFLPKAAVFFSPNLNIILLQQSTHQIRRMFYVDGSAEFIAPTYAS